MKKASSIYFVFLALLIFLLPSQKGLGQESLWQIQAVDSSAGVGQNPSIAVDANGKAYISYFKDTSTMDKIKFATNRSGSWVLDYIYSMSSYAHLGQYSSVAISGNKAYVCYYIISTVGYLRDLELWTKDFASGTASIEVRDNGGSGSLTAYVGNNCNIAIDSQGGIHISYYDEIYKDIKYQFQSLGGSWVTETAADAGPPEVGPWNSLALDAAGNAHLAYYHDKTLGTQFDRLLYKMRPAGPGQSFGAQQVVDDDPPPQLEDIGKYNSIAVDSNGKLHLCYRVVNPTIFPSYSLVYITNESGNWVRTPLTSSESVGFLCSISVGGNPERVHISYTRESNATLLDQLWYAWRELSSVSLNSEMIIEGNNISYNDLAVDTSGGVHIAYYDGTGLKYAFKAPPSIGLSRPEGGIYLGPFTPPAEEESGDGGGGGGGGGGGAVCTADTDCAAGEVCVAGACIVVGGIPSECGADTDCAEGEVCTEGECVDASIPPVVTEVCFCGDRLRCEGDTCTVLVADATGCAASANMAGCDPNTQLGEGSLIRSNVVLRSDIPAITFPPQTNPTEGGCQLQPNVPPQLIHVGLMGLALGSLLWASRMGRFKK